MKVIGYARTSTQSQGIGLEKQKQKIRDYCENNGYELIGIHSEKVSGRTKLINIGFENQEGNELEHLPYLEFSGREELGNAYHSSRSDSFEIDRVVVFNPSRLARKSHYQGMLEEVFQEAGAEVEYVESSGKWIVRKIQSIFDEYEVRQTIQRTKDSLQQKKEDGEWIGRSPVGFDIDDETGKLVYDKPLYNMLLDADDHYENTDDGYKKTADYINETYFEEEYPEIKSHQVRTFVNRDKDKIQRFLKES